MELKIMGYTMEHTKGDDKCYSAVVMGNKNGSLNTDTYVPATVEGAFPHT